MNNRKKSNLYELTFNQLIEVVSLYQNIVCKISSKVHSEFAHIKRLFFVEKREKTIFSKIFA